MAHGLRVARTVLGLRQTVARFREANETVALVPTMGALHDGHLSLVRLARRKADRVVVSIFVNPAQFAPHEDFATYPRTFGTDRAALARAGVDLIWAPSGTVMYPPEFATRIMPAGPASVGLEDAIRPHFFSGVATVVAKLLLQCLPDVALFGEKDYQQLKVVTQMASDLAIPVKIIGAPTMRERDGLAMSSRNAYLTAEQRALAPLLYRALRSAAKKIAAGQTIPAVLSEGRKEISRAGFVLDYFEARHARTLEPIRTQRDGPIRLLIAARLGKTRLIDNIAVSANR